MLRRDPSTINQQITLHSGMNRWFRIVLAAPLLLMAESSCDYRGDEVVCGPSEPHLSGPCLYINSCSQPLRLWWELSGQRFWSDLGAGDSVMVNLFDGHGTAYHAQLGVAQPSMWVEANERTTTLVGATDTGERYKARMFDEKSKIERKTIGLETYYAVYRFTDSVLVALSAEAQAAGVDM